LKLGTIRFLLAEKPSIEGPQRVGNQLAGRIPVPVVCRNSADPNDGPGVAATMAAMSYHPWQFLLVALAGWINRHQQDAL